MEKNHTIFRNIAKPGTSFDDFCQDDVNVIFSHVNGVKRRLFNGKSPYEMFIFTHGKYLAKTLGVDLIEPENVVQSPLLLRQILNSKKIENLQSKFHSGNLSGSYCGEIYVVEFSVRNLLGGRYFIL